MPAPQKQPHEQASQQPDDPAQSKRFEDAARELEADETGEAFERALGVVAPAVTPAGSVKKPD